MTHIGRTVGWLALLLGCPASTPAPPSNSPTTVAAPSRPASQPPPGASELARVQGLLAQGKTAEAEQVLTELLDTHPTLGQGWLMLAYARRARGDLAAARSALKQALDLPEFAAKSKFQLGLLAAAEGDLDQGFTLLLEAARSGRVDTTTVVTDPGFGAIAADPRHRELFPSPAEYASPFVEPVHVLHEWNGASKGEQFGWIARNIGDVDGDGAADLVSSSPTHGEASEGRIAVYSSRTGAMLWERTGPAKGLLGYGVEAAGDVNGDGVPDVVAGAPGTAQAFVYGGADGRPLLTVNGDEGTALGGSACGAGDIDGDGRGDLLIAAASAAGPGGEPGAGVVTLRSGRDGTVLHAWYGPKPGAGFGSTVGCGPRPDDRLLVVGAGGDGEHNRGRVYVYRAPTPEPAFVIAPEPSGRSLGAMFVSVLGDVDGDGRDDVYASDWSDSTLGARTGRIYVHSGATGARLYTLSGEAAGDGYGIGVATVGDATGDGRADLLVGAWQHASAAPGGGKIYLHDGRDGALLRTITGQVMGETLGFDTTGLGDVDGDGHIDWLVTSAWSSKVAPRAGRAWLLSGAPP